MKIEGSVMFPLNDNIKLMIEVDGRYEKIELFDDDTMDKEFFGVFAQDGGNRS